MVTTAQINEFVKTCGIAHLNNTLLYEFHVNNASKYSKHCLKLKTLSI